MEPVRFGPGVRLTESAKDVGALIGEVAEQLPRRQDAGGLDPEQSFGDADTGQWCRPGQPGPGDRAPGDTSEDGMALRRVERRQIELLIGLDEGELDPIEQRITEHPAAWLEKRREAVAKARLQKTQPGAVGPVGEDHDGVSPGTCRPAGQATIPFSASASPSRSSPSRQWRTSSPRLGRWGSGGNMLRP